MLKYTPILALLSALCLLLSACGRSAMPPKPQEETTAPIRLTIEDVFVPYTDAESDAFANRLTVICRRSMRLLYGIELSAEKCAELQADILSRRLPSLQEQRVTVAELSKMCDGMEQALDRMGAAKDDPDSKNDAAEAFFHAALRLLGPSRVGALAYDTTLFWLDDRIAACERNYAEYGYEFFLTDAAYYRALREELTVHLDASVFQKLCSAVMFASSVSGGMDTLSGFLTDAEWLLLLQKQADSMDEAQITPAQWNTFFTVLHELDVSMNLLQKTLPSPIADELRLLLGENARKTISEALPTLTALYGETLHLMTSADLHALRTDTREARIETLCKLLLRKENTLPRLLDTVSSISYATDAEVNALKRHGLWESYLTYAEALPEVDATVLTDAVRACAEAPSTENCNALLRLSESFLHKSLPYATYIFFEFEEVPA